MIHQKGPAAFALAFLAGCQPESTVNALKPDIVLAYENPEVQAVDFGEVVVPYDATQWLQIINAGRAPLKISDFRLAQDDGVYTLDFGDTDLSGGETLTIEQDETVPIEVRFEPKTYLPYDTELVIVSNDPDNGELPVSLKGEGVDGPVPAISVDPQTLDFGTVGAGDTQMEYFTITNVGDGPLTIDAVELSGAGSFDVLTNPLNQQLPEQGSEVQVIVTYEAPDDVSVGDWGKMVIGSNDPITPEVEVTFLANGGGSFEYPVALIDAPAEANPLDTITLDGTGSYDPYGNEPLTYEWELVAQPSVSTTTISNTSSASPSLYVDTAGAYAITLQVTNSVGVKSAKAMLGLDADPDQDIYVVMAWNTGDSDLDLHIIKGDGTEDSLFGDPEDCCWCNPFPDWGTSGDAEDPDYALDNRLGYGPENINVETADDDEYFVRVQYFQDIGGGTTQATVKIYIGGSLEYEGSQSLDHGEVWNVAYVRWPEGYVIEEEDDPYKTDKRECE